MPSVARLSGDASSPPRFINPHSPIADQITTLKALIKDPPENSRIIAYSPALAQFILDELNKPTENAKNRKFKPIRVRRYGDVMAAEEWVLTGDTIKFSKHSKRLLDGQNRLAGCVRADKVFRSHTVFGIDDGAFATIDSNKVRTNQDTLFVYGVPNSSLVTPGVRWVKIHRDATATESPNRALQMTNPEVLDYYKANIDKSRMAEAAERVREMPGSLFKRGLMRGSLTGLMYLFAESHPATAKKLALDFIRDQRGIRKLVQRLAKIRNDSDGRISETLHNALVIKCWNLYRHNHPVTLKDLTWKGNQDYPTIE